MQRIEEAEMFMFWAQYHQGGMGMVPTASSWGVAFEELSGEETEGSEI